VGFPLFFPLLILYFSYDPGSRCCRSEPAGESAGFRFLSPTPSSFLPSSLSDLGSGRRAESGGDEQDSALDPSDVHHGSGDSAYYCAGKEGGKERKGQGGREGGREAKCSANCPYHVPSRPPSLPLPFLPPTSSLRPTPGVGKAPPSSSAPSL